VLKGTAKNKKSKATGSSALELVSNNQFDLLEIKVLQLLRELQETKDERDRLRTDLENSQSGLSESLEAKSKELESKEQILRRQQSVLKTKETSLQELQQALTEQREQVETLAAENQSIKEEMEKLKTRATEAVPMDQESRDQIRYRMEKVVQKLDQLEKIIQTS
jgi:chromosome segregation ATPase